MRDSTFVHVTLFLKALSLFFSWNALMNTGHFFVSKAGGRAGNDFVVDYLIIAFVFVRVVLLFPAPLLFSLVSPFKMVAASSIGTVVCFLLLAVVSIFDISPSILSIIICLITTGLSSFFSLVAYIGVFRYISTLSSSYIRTLSIGFGVASVLISGLRICSLFVFPPASDGADPPVKTHHDATMFFFLAAFICSCATILFCYSKKHVQRLSSRDGPDKDLQEHGNRCDNGRRRDSGEEPFIKSSADDISSCNSNNKLIHLICRVKWHLLWLFHCSVQVAIATPNIIYLTKSSYDPNRSGDPVPFFLSDTIFPLFALAIHAIGDFFGRLSLRIPLLAKISHNVWGCVIFGRFIVLSFLLLGNITPISQKNSHFLYLPQVYSSDIAFLMLVCLFGFTGGAITTTLLMTIPSSFVHERDRKRISIWMVAFQSFGFLCGSLVSFGLKLFLYQAIVDT